MEHFPQWLWMSGGICLLLGGACQVAAAVINLIALREEIADRCTIEIVEQPDRVIKFIEPREDGDG